MRVHISIYKAVVSTAMVHVVHIRISAVRLADTTKWGGLFQVSQSLAGAPACRLSAAIVGNTLPAEVSVPPADDERK